MNINEIFCRLFSHNIHLLDFIELGTEFQLCTRCGWKNYRIDTYGQLHKTEQEKDFSI